MVLRIQRSDPRRVELAAHQLGRVARNAKKNKHLRKFADPSGLPGCRNAAEMIHPCSFRFTTHAHRVRAPIDGPAQ